jgi:DNA-binding transcriptional MocR family regulator
MNVLEQYAIEGGGAEAIAASVERGVREGRLAPGARLPTVREVAAGLGVSPATVAAAYATLRRRGVVATQGRRGTRVSERPPLPTTPPARLPPGIHDVAQGSPDPALLPSLQEALRRLRVGTGLYGEHADLPELVELAGRQLAADGVPAERVTVVGGAMDGIERVLGAHLRPGDRVVVEDPGYPAVFALLGALGLRAEPARVDLLGLVPEQLEQALAGGAAALVATPRAQNPTGAALDGERAAALRAVLAAHPSVLVVEDDHAALVAGAAYQTLCGGRERWAVIRSVSKALGPDLRLAVLAGDPDTVARVEGRRLLGTGWVSHVLQRTVVALLTDPACARLLERATAAYARRRESLVAALAARGVGATGRSGLNVWLPVAEEARTVALLLERGWAVAPGERYRLRTPPAVRVTVSSLRRPAEVERLADDIAAAFAPGRRTWSA